MLALPDTLFGPQAARACAVSVWTSHGRAGMTEQIPPSEAHDWREERWEMVRHLNDLTDKPMIALAFVWLALLIVDLTSGLEPLLQTVSNVIWALFVLDFVLEFSIAPHKRDYLRHNWLTAISLVLPALRIFRVFRAFRILQAARTTRALSLVRVVSSFNRGMRAIQNALGRRGFGTIVLITIILLFVGAAGMLAFESAPALREAGYTASPNDGLNSYGEAVWWTAMLLTSLGSEYWPQTVEGRILCWLLSLYALGVFGYITATIATYFIGTAPSKPAEASDVAALRREVELLRTQLAPTGKDDR